jgi:hypothetical protein
MPPSRLNFFSPLTLQRSNASTHPISADLLPDFDLRHAHAQFFHARQQCLDVRILQMRVEMRLAGPVFVKEKFFRVFRQLMQVVIEAARFQAGRGNQREQGLFQICGFPGLGLKSGHNSNGGNRFCAHKYLINFVGG